jgi:hypothetical protein
MIDKLGPDTAENSQSGSESNFGIKLIVILMTLFMPNELPYSDGVSLRCI